MQAFIAAGMLIQGLVGVPGTLVHRPNDRRSSDASPFNSLVGATAGCQERSSDRCGCEGDLGRANAHYSFRDGHSD
jgi:hypothetical protein